MLVRDTTTIKVADFGICRIDGGDANDATQQTQIGNVLGTPHYMSPEQVIGREGRLALRPLLRRRRALPAAHRPPALRGRHADQRRLQDHQDRAAVARQAARRTCRCRCGASIERALRKQPDKRFQTGEEFAQALIGVARELTKARRQEGHARGGIPLGVRWALIMAALVAITMTLTATVLYKQQYAAMMDQVEGLRRIARQVHGHAECRAAAVRGLGGDGRLRPGNARSPAEISITSRSSITRASCARATWRRGSTQKYVAPRCDAGAVEGSAASPCQSHRMRRRPAGARLRRPGAVPGQDDRPTCTSASTRRR